MGQKLSNYFLYLIVHLISIPIVIYFHLIANMQLSV